MPDFDIDFCMQGRDRVINYVQKKYGFNNMANNYFWIFSSKSSD